MAVKKIHLKIITPYGRYMEEDVESITTRTTDGYIGIQKNRVPLIASLVISKLFVKKDNKDEVYIVEGGMIYSTKDDITIITDNIDLEKNHDINKVIREKEALERKMKQKLDNKEMHLAELSLNRLIDKINVLGK